MGAVLQLRGVSCQEARLAEGSSACAALTNVDEDGSAIMAAALVHPVHPLIGLQQRGADHIRQARHVFLSPGQKRDQVLR